MCKYYKTKTGISELNLIKKIENVCKEKTILILNLFKKYSGQINPDTIKNNILRFKNDNNESVSDKKFLSSNLFLANNSIIPKIWTLLFSFKNDSNTLKYIIDNLLPFERDIFYIIKDQFYDRLDDKKQIEDFVEFTNQTNFFYNEKSFLWKDLIGEKIGKNLRKEQYESMINKINQDFAIFVRAQKDKINNYLNNEYLDNINHIFTFSSFDIASKREIRK